MLITTLLMQINVVTNILPGKHELRDTSVNYIVLHYDEGKSYTGTRSSLIRKGNSYHYYVKRDGTVVKLLDPKYKANHAGISYYKKKFGLNMYSIGICLQNKPPQQYTSAQYKSLRWLILDLQKRYNDSTTRIILGHSDVALPRGRKKDPGKHFSWMHLRTMIKQ